MAEWKSDSELFSLCTRELYTPVVGDILDDLGFTHRGGLLYLNYHRGKAQYAALVTRTPADLGLKSF